MKRNDWCLKDDEYHLTALGVVRRTDGKFLITRRVMTKSWAPGHWEVPGGGVMAGETSYEAAVREVLEETGIDVKDAKSELVLTYHRENPGEGDNYFVDVYRFTLDFNDEDVKIQEEETSGYKIADISEIEALGRGKVFLHFDSIREAFD